jgi:hypothetical protein
MEGTLIFFTILSVVWSVLNIILFFKIWKMTAHIRQVRDLMFQQHYNIDTLRGIRIGDNVVRKFDGKTYMVKGLDWSSAKTLLDLGVAKVESQSVLTMDEYAKHKESINIGTLVSFTEDGYYTYQGVVKSIQENGMVTIEIGQHPKDMPGMVTIEIGQHLKEMPITQLTPVQDK